jgi:SAM-dependent methyltransferase
MLFEKYAKPFFKSGLRVLEIGPDGFPSTYQRLVNDASLVWDTLDLYESPQLTYSKSNEYCFEIPDASYDIVLSGQVIEHVRKPWIWIKELARVTKPEGLVITINPVSWDYHESPVDCWRIYPEGMKALYGEACLTVLVSTFESLETPQYRRFVPGRSMESQTPKRRIYYRILGKCRLPVERSYDTITIGIKKNGPEQFTSAGANSFRRCAPT